jgi:hypothetical protein
MRKDYYAQLARALLDVGDRPTSISRFLRDEYGLTVAGAKEAIAKGRVLKVEPDTMVLPRPRYRQTL